jgi:hypothetical protein
MDQQLEYLHDEIRNGSDKGMGSWANMPDRDAGSLAADLSSIGVRPRDVEGNRRARAATAMDYYNQFAQGASPATPAAGLAPRAAPTEANISTNTTTAPGVGEATWQGSPENVASMRRLLGRRLEEEQNPGWFTRNKEWLVPILAGAGAMASSNSRYLGSALLQGLGAGATAAGAMDYKTQAQNAAVAEQFNRTTNEGEQTPRIQAEAQRAGVFALPDQAVCVRRQAGRRNASSHAAQGA